MSNILIRSLQSIQSLFPASISSDPKSWNWPGWRSRLRTKWTPESSLPWVPPTSATRLHRMALLLLRATTAQAVTAKSGRGGYRRWGRGGKHSVKGAIPWSTRSIRRIWDGLAPIWWLAKIIYMRLVHECQCNLYEQKSICCFSLPETSSRFEKFLKSGK